MSFSFGVRFIWLYRVVFVVMVLLGGFIELDMVWIIADIVNALMALPNLIALLVLSPVVIAETKKYFKLIQSHFWCDFSFHKHFLSRRLKIYIIQVENSMID